MELDKRRPNLYAFLHLSLRDRVREMDGVHPCPRQGDMAWRSSLSRREAERYGWSAPVSSPRRDGMAFLHLSLRSREIMDGMPPLLSPRTDGMAFLHLSKDRSRYGWSASHVLAKERWHGIPPSLSLRSREIWMESHPCPLQEWIERHSSICR